MDGTPTPESDARYDRRILLVSTGAVGALFAGATTVQSVLALGVFSTVIRGVDPTPVTEIAVRGAVNLLTVLVLLGLVAVLRPEQRSRPAGILTSLVCVIATGFARAAAQLVSGVYTLEHSTVWLTEIVTTSIAAAVTLVIGLTLVGSWRRLRAAERRRSESRLESLVAYRELQDEELRVRREVAQSIHGSVQSAFVMLEAELDDLAGRVAPEEGERLRRAAGTVERLREEELRTLSGTLYPVAVDAGLEAALVALTVRLPAHVAVEADFAPAARSLDAGVGSGSGSGSGDVSGSRSERGLPFSVRLLIVRIAEEALSNALRHGRARSVRVTLRAEPGAAVLVVDDDGSGVRAGGEWSGLRRLERHLDVLGGSLELVPSEALGGCRLRATVPFDAEVSRERGA